MQNDNSEKTWRPSDGREQPPTSPYDPMDPETKPDRVPLPPDAQPQPPVPGREPDGPNPLGPNDLPAGDPPSNRPQQLTSE